MIHDVPRWVAREAEPAGWSSRAGGPRAAGQAGQRSSRAAREAGSAGQKLQLMFLVKKNPHLSQSERIWPVCLHFKNCLIFLF